MDFRATLKLQNAKLWEAVKKCGSQSALAKYLEVQPQIIGDWLNFRKVPAIDSPNFRKKYEAIEEKLLVLVGYGLDDIFPEEVRVNRARLAELNEQEKYFSQPIENLLTTNERFLLQSPDEQVFEKERGELVIEALAKLNPRQAQVVKKRFGLDGEIEHTLEETAYALCVTRERVRQIEAAALRKLRHPENSRVLRQFAG